MLGFAINTIFVLQETFFIISSTDALKFFSLANTIFALLSEAYILYMIKPNSVTITSSPGLRNKRQVRSKIWSEPDPQIILLKSRLNFKKDKIVLNLLEDEYGISPGQACVFYSKNNLGDKVLGGGWIYNNNQ